MDGWKNKKVPNKNLVCNTEEDKTNKNLIKEEGSSISKTGYASHLRHKFENTMWFVLAQMWL